MKWYYAKNNEQFGPVERNEIDKLIANKTITPYDMVWNSTMDNWTLAGNVKELFPDTYIFTNQVPENIITDFEKLTSNRDIQQKSLDKLRGNWSNASGIYLLYVLIIYAVSIIPFVGDAAPLILGGPFMFGLYNFFLNIARQKKCSINQLFDGFIIFEQTFFTNILITVFTILWMLLFIIPGIIAALSYSMSFFILIDNPHITPFAAIGISKKMMNGNKKKFFYLQCRFIPWIILAVLTFGIGFIWLYPYILTAHAEFYEDLRKNQTVK